jgi:hypothetical protein
MSDEKKEKYNLMTFGLFLTKQTMSDEKKEKYNLMTFREH